MRQVESSFPFSKSDKNDHAWNHGKSPWNVSKNFLGGSKIGEISFYPLETKKKNFFRWNFQNPGGQGLPDPPFRRPWWKLA